MYTHICIRSYTYMHMHIYTPSPIMCCVWGTENERLGDQEMEGPGYQMRLRRTQDTTSISSLAT